MKTFDVVVVGELNVDIILNQIDRFPEMGKEILAHSLDMTLGSSSAIFASNLSSIGSHVAFIGKIGKDSFASAVLDNLKAKQVDTSHIIRSETANTGATIVLNFGQDRAMVTYPGAMEELTLRDIDETFLKTAGHLHLSSVFLQPGIRNDLPDLFREARGLGLTTSLDPQWDPSEKWDMNLPELLPFVNVFLPNLAEFLNLTGAGSLKEGIGKVSVYAPGLITVVKDGSNGAFMWDGERIIHQPAFLNENVADCIGAGDSFNAGFIRKFTEGVPLSECLEFGALTGAVSTTRAGGTGAFSNRETIRKLALENFNVKMDI
jgi:sugar/nucleoside kinase (ribokinase family)